MRGSVSLHVKDNLPQSAAEAIVSHLSAAVRSHGVATFVLSGGSTPRAVYTCLASEALRARVDWSRVHLFWGDERCVPHTHPESNFKMVNESLLRAIEIPERNVHRIEAEGAPEESASLYEMVIRRFFDLREGQLPDFDVLLLGMGDDGHTASLFPGTPAIDERGRLVSAVFVESLKTHRITLTFPVINNASHILILVTGQRKAHVLREVAEAADLRYPIQYVNPTRGSLYWMVDAEAASLLPKGTHP